jgi:excisionase family DNA binding protein
MEPNRKMFFSVAEFVDITGIGRTKVYAEIKCGRLKVTKVGRRTLIHVDDVNAYVQALRSIAA